MRIKNRLTPYPILDNYGDDYINSSFTANYEVTAQFSEVYGKITFELINKEIQELIDTNKATYTVHIECPSTSYRVVKQSFEKEIEFKLSSSDLSKKIEIRTFIVLQEDISNFTSSCFHPDYSNQKFNLNKHQIIAIGTAKDFDINQDDRDLESFPSIIQMVRLKDKKKGSICVNTDNDDHIIIGLAEEVYDQYARLGKQMYRSTAFCLILLPALIVIMQRMQENKDDSDMNSRHWFQVIDTLLKNNGFDLDDISINNDTMLTICQSVFADPIARSLKELDTFCERMM